MTRGWEGNEDASRAWKSDYGTPVCLCEHTFKVGRGLGGYTSRWGNNKSGDLSLKNNTGSAAAAIGTMRDPTRTASWAQIRESRHSEIKSMDFGLGP